MLKNYFKVAFRNLWKDKGFSAINIFGLAMGLAVCLLIALFVTDELSYDRYNDKADRIYRINADLQINNNGLHSATVPAPMGPALVKDYPRIEKYVRFMDTHDLLIKKGNETIMEHHSVLADSSLFDVFSIRMIAGDPRKALTEPHSMVLSESMAKKYFPGVDPLGKTLLTGNTTQYKITGVIKDMPPQSHFHFNFIKAMSEEPDSRRTEWLSNNYITYLLVREGTSQSSIDGYLDESVRKYLAPQLQAVVHASLEDLAKNGGYFKYRTMPVEKIHLYSNLTYEFETNGSAQYVYIFIVIAVFILLIACVNFMNLSTARSAGRSKEVGIRKVLGSLRSNLISQFLAESVLTSFIALLLAVGLAALLIPYFNQLSGKQISLGLFSKGWMIPSLLLTSLVVGLLAGSYPAFYLSGFQPIQVLKGKLTAGFKNGWLRNSLVVFQFATAILLIVGTLVIHRQLDYIRNKKLGYDREQVLTLQNTYSLWVHAKAFKEEISGLPGIQSATMTRDLPNAGDHNINGVFKDPGLRAEEAVIMDTWSIDADYISTLGMQMAKGRNFSPQLPTDSSAVLINETAAQLLGYNDPLNKMLYRPTGDSNKAVGYRIIGVVKDFHPGSLHNKIAPIMFNLGEERGAMSFRIRTKNISSLIAQIRDRYHAVEKMAGQPFIYSFMDDDFNHLYQADQRTGKIFMSFSLFAILIACLGLFGLVTYAAEQRTKEIGIRKVLGAGVGSIVHLLSKDFLKLVVVAALIAIPLAWWGMDRWLQDFAYRTSISWWVFAVAAGLAGIITICTVSFRAIRAALANPTKSLRAE